MIELEKSLYINELYDLYGSLLTKKQQEIIELYYCDDLSLSEISEQLNVSRNAIYDCLKKGIKQLENYEKELRLYQKHLELDAYFDMLKKENKEQISLIEEIERKVK
jgi:predicted DNA-binding protein YlxM (UPF0122 family)